jgi:hypothetical protein
MELLGSRVRTTAARSWFNHLDERDWSRSSSINENGAGSCTWQSSRVLLLIDNGDGIACKTHSPVLNYTATPPLRGGPRSAHYATGQPETLSSVTTVMVCEIVTTVVLQGQNYFTTGGLLPISSSSRQAS